MRLPAAIAVVLALAATGCVSAPLAIEGARTDLPAWTLAEDPALRGESVVLGGMIVEVRNREASSEIVVLAYPLDRRQRPRLDAPSEGRFIAVVSGFLEPYAWPQGRFVSLRGRYEGTREARVGEHALVHPVVEVENLHLWPAGFQESGPRFSIGIGIAR